MGFTVFRKIFGRADRKSNPISAKALYTGKLYPCDSGPGICREYQQQFDHCNINYLHRHCGIIHGGIWNRKIFPKLGSIMSKVLVATYMFPPILLAIPYSMVMAKLGFVNTRVGLVIVYLSFSVPYAVWMLVGFFKTVPLGIEEAARVDGANKLQTFVRIVLPLVMPGIVATAIYTFINAWNEFLYSLILINSTDKMTVSVALKSLQGSEILNWGDMMAASALVVVPSVIFFMFIQNKIAGGMTDGAVK